MAERIVTNASGMIGASATLIALVKIVGPRGAVSRVDKYAAGAALAFVIAALLAHVAVRIGHRPGLQRRLEAVADLIFLAALVALAGIGTMFAFDVI